MGLGHEYIFKLCDGCVDLPIQVSLGAAISSPVSDIGPEVLINRRPNVGSLKYAVSRLQDFSINMPEQGADNSRTGNTLHAAGHDLIGLIRRNHLFYIR